MGGIYVHTVREGGYLVRKKEVGFTDIREEREGGNKRVIYVLNGNA